MRTQPCNTTNAVCIAGLLTVLLWSCPALSNEIFIRLGAWA